MHIDCSLLYQHAITTSTGPQTQPTFDEKHKKWGEIRINLQATVQGKPAKTEEDPPASQDVAAGWMRGPWDERSSLAYGVATETFATNAQKANATGGSTALMVLVVILLYRELDLWICGSGHRLCGSRLQTACSMASIVPRYTPHHACVLPGAARAQTRRHTPVHPCPAENRLGERRRERERESNGYGPGR